jgi:hypothetical protein
VRGGRGGGGAKRGWVVCGLRGAPAEPGGRGPCWAGCCCAGGAACRRLPPPAAACRRLRRLPPRPLPAPFDTGRASAAPRPPPALRRQLLDTRGALPAPPPRPLPASSSRACAYHACCDAAPRSPAAPPRPRPRPRAARTWPGARSKGRCPRRRASCPHRRCGSWGPAHRGSTGSWGRAYPLTACSSAPALREGERRAGGGGGGGGRRAAAAGPVRARAGAARPRRGRTAALPAPRHAWAAGRGRCEAPAPPLPTCCSAAPRPGRRAGVPPRRREHRNAGTDLSDGPPPAAGAAAPPRARGRPAPGPGHSRRPILSVCC